MLTLSAGGTVPAPVVTTTGSMLTVIELPNGVVPGDVVIPSSLDLTTIDTSAFTTCFAPGTPIASPDGDIPVETLSVGDLVTTADGRAVPVTWLGQQSVNRFTASLVQIRQGALGAGRSNCDLIVTGDHGMVLDGVIVNATAPVNGGTITWALLNVLSHPRVYHVETEAHDVILAAGAETEPFFDVAGRTAFDNHGAYQAPYGTARTIPEMSLPRITSARLVPLALREKLGLPLEFDLPVWDVA